jgi:hydroxyacylglutathione hydrolase
LLIHKIVVGELSTNCYIVNPEGSNEAAIIDPGGEAEKILGVINENKLMVKYIINTHGHYDHTAANERLTKATGLSVLIHPEDIALLTDPGLTFFFYSGRKPSSKTPASELFEGQILNLGNSKMEILYTPGHTRGSVSILVNDFLFTGDLLFKGSVGRTDLPGGSLDMLIKSLSEKIIVLPGSTKVFPGHGPETTIGEELWWLHDFIQKCYPKTQR